MFGVFAQGNEFTIDELNGPLGLHNVRVFPAEKANGGRIRHAWLIAVDVGHDPDPVEKNCDYNDMIFLLTNAREP